MASPCLLLLASPVACRSRHAWQIAARALVLQPHRQQHSRAGAAGEQQQQQQQPQQSWQPIYTGWFSTPHKRLKLASLVSSTLSLGATPFLLEASAVSPVARVAAATSIFAFALITTGGLAIFTKPYVHELQYAAARDRLRAKTLSFLGRPVWSEFGVDEVQQPSGYHPLASFKAKGRVFYVDRGAFPAAHLDLLERLMPGAAAEVAEQQQQQQAAAAAAAKQHAQEQQARQPEQ